MSHDDWLPMRSIERDKGYPFATSMQSVYGEDMRMGDGYSRCFALMYRMALELGVIDYVKNPDGTVITGFNDDRTERLRKLLSPGEERSFYILWKWWATCSTICIVDEAGYSWDDIFGDEGDDDDDDDESHLYPQTQVQHETIHRVGGVWYKLRFKCAYNKSMATLFNAEFTNFVLYRDGDNLRDDRRTRARNTACINIAIEACSSLSQTQQPTQAPYSPDGQSYLAHRSESSPAWRAERRVLGSSDLPGLDPRCSTGSSIESCPWLGDISGCPFYLWDLKERRTVEFFTIWDEYNLDVPYTAVSHTWGRWRQRDQPGANMKPHVPWLIPRNSLFDVERLPDILVQIPTDTRYIWFDLVCIPQEGCGEEIDKQLRKVMVEEIASQASIFKGAKHTIAWWNTDSAPESWEGMRSAIQWMSSIYMDLQFSDGDEYPVRIPPWEAHDRLQATGLFSPDMTILPWFSSLWTLQEVCLRPDIWICNKNLELLTVGDNGTPVAFNTLVSLAEGVKSALTWEFKDLTTPEDHLLERWKPLVHPGFHEVLDLLHRTGMDSLHELKREQILFLATSRYCSHSRAQAIMSVLGIKEWYNSATATAEQRQPNKPGFIFDQYPLAFVQEAARNMGSRFFNTAVLVDYPPVDEVGAQEIVRGTMLPFRARISEPRRLYVPGIETADHPSISTWEIRGDGAVLVPKVEILFSSHSEYGDINYMTCFVDLSIPVPEHIVEREHFEPQGSMYHGDLRRWIKQLIPEIYGDGIYYAVHVQYRRGQWFGVLLKAIGSRDSSQPEKMIKIGNLLVLTLRGDEEYLPRRKSATVNWIVL
ncbi:Heterokaryon incompatibility [Penicillium angulare]|uniref:Heterokaryon incompatibility n=1 Tax=Penicillium angulare TaxID=116970 RepID=A0A9W9EFM5_9EURO|nr:Heterokaryon incompatibility [Penicillium angulare]